MRRTFLTPGMGVDPATKYSPGGLLFVLGDRIPAHEKNHILAASRTRYVP